jgi:hypothetical protein
MTRLVISFNLKLQYGMRPVLAIDVNFKLYPGLAETFVQSPDLRVRAVSPEAWGLWYGP